MSAENAKKYLDDHHDKDITELMVEHGKAMGHEFSEKDLLEASGGGSISWKKSGVKWKFWLLVLFVKHNKMALTRLFL